MHGIPSLELLLDFGTNIGRTNTKESKMEPFRYDLITLGQELLSQLATPMSMNFSDAMKADDLNVEKLTTTGNLYIELLNDIDALLSGDPASMVGPWLEMAKEFGKNSDADDYIDRRVSKLLAAHIFMSGTQGCSLRLGTQPTALQVKYLTAQMIMPASTGLV